MAFANPFQNKFLSIAGQKERLANVATTLKSAITGQGVVSNTGQKTVDKVLGAAASNPFATALVGAVAAAPSAAIGALKAGFGALPTGGKAAVVIAAPVAIGAVAQNPKLVTQAAQAPKELSQFGSGLGQLIAEPSVENAKELLRDSPVISAGLAAAGIATVGLGTANLVATALNTQAIRDNSETIGGPNQVVLGPSPTSTAGPAMVPYTRETQVIGREAGNRSISKKRAAKKKESSTNLRVNILNQNTYIEGDT